MMNILKRLTVFSVFVLGGLIFSATAQADIIFDNGAPDLIAPDFSGGAVSDLNSSLQVGDDFVLQPGHNVITNIHWWGFYTANEPIPASNFTLRIFEFDASGNPTLIPLYNIYKGSNVTATDASPDFVGDFEYDAPISPITLSSGATYLLSIVNDTSGSSNPWAWWEAAIPGLPPSVEKWYRSTDSNSWNNYIEVYNQSFYLSGPSTPVPEPTTMLLLGLGLMGLAGVRRKFTN